MLLLVLLLVTAVGPILNNGLSAAGPILVRDLGISQGQFGMLSSLLFISAACASTTLGRLADILSTRVQMVLNFGGTAAALILSSIGPAYGLLAASVVLGGISQAIANPTTNRVIHRDVAPSRRPAWVGVKQSGVQVSQLVAGLSFPAMALILGWSGAALAAAGTVLLLLAWSLFHLPSEERTLWPAVRNELLRMPTKVTGDKSLPPYVWFMTAAAFLSGAGTQATNVYLSLFAFTGIGMDALTGGLALAISGALGVTSRIWWGILLGRGRSPNVVLMVISVGAVTAMASMAVASALKSPVGFWIGVILHGSCVLGTNVVITTAILETVEKTRIGLASGAITMGMYAGFAAGPILMGATVDITGSFLLGWTMAAFTYGLLFSLTVGMLLHQRKPRIE